MALHLFCEASIFFAALFLRSFLGLNIENYLTLFFFLQVILRLKIFVRVLESNFYDRYTIR